MDDIEALATHMANLTFVMDFHEKMGTSRNPTIGREFQRCHDRLIHLLEEKEDAARKSRDVNGGAQAGAEGPRDLPRRGGPTGTGHWPEPGIRPPK